VAYFCAKKTVPRISPKTLRPTLLQIGGEAETKISSLLSDIEKNGKSFTICRNGKPVAELIPYRKPSRLAYHPVLTRIQIHYDPTEDLSKDEWGESTRICVTALS
jgi:antitoxin (DNA-binding transcriptional repressor) of toxin-antitoxin stability system